VAEVLAAGVVDDESYITAQQNTLQLERLIKHNDGPAMVKRQKLGGIFWPSKQQ
jgi:hypothetical protein